MTKAKIQNDMRKLRFFAKKMTQRQLAQKVGVTRQTIMAIEGSRYSPSLALAFRIARVFGKKLDEVFWYDDGQALSSSPDKQTVINVTAVKKQSFSTRENVTKTQATVANVQKRSF